MDLQYQACVVGLASEWGESQCYCSGYGVIAERRLAWGTRVSIRFTTHCFLCVYLMSLQYFMERILEGTSRGPTARPPGSEVS